MSNEQITSKVDEIIQDLDLTRCVDTSKYKRKIKENNYLKNYGYFLNFPINVSVDVSSYSEFSNY